MSHAKKNYVYALRENQYKRREDWKKKRKRRDMIGYQFILKKPFIKDNFYE